MGRMKAVGLCWSFPSGPVTTTQVQLHKTACSGTLCFLYIGLGAPLLSCRWQGFWGNIFCPPIFRVSRMECITSNICDIISKGKVALAFLLTISRNYVPSLHPHHFFFFFLVSLSYQRLLAKLPLSRSSPTLHSQLYLRVWLVCSMHLVLLHKRSNSSSFNSWCFFFLRQIK